MQAWQRAVKLRLKNENCSALLYQSAADNPTYAVTNYTKPKKI
jgi:hypothetical protein